LVAVCYANSIPNAFILDDILIVAANERIRHVQPVQFLLQPYWGDVSHLGIYRPLTIFSFSVEYSIWQLWTAGFRITNLLLHALNGWLVYLVAQGLLGSPLAALATAAVYVIHPVQTEAVVSIVGRSELLAAALFFTAWLAFRKGRTAWSAAAYFFAALATVTGDYDFNSIPIARPGDWDAWFGLALVVGSIVTATLFRKTRPAVTLGILFFFVALLPVSNWFMPIALLMAERFLYMPVFGFALLAGAAWAAIPDLRLRRLVASGTVAVAVLLCISHNYLWQDTLTFHENAVRIVPNNARARLGYGFVLLRMNKADEAKAQFEAGLRIMPQSAPLVAGLARTMMRID